MKLFSFLSRKSASDGGSIVSAKDLADAISGAPSKTGITVTNEKALQVATVLGCVRVLADGVAEPDLMVVRLRKDGRGFEPVREGSESRLLGKRPNDWQTSFEFRETMQMHATLGGNGYGLKVPVDATKPAFGANIAEILPLLPGQVKVEQKPDYGLVYTVSDMGGRTWSFPRDRIFHLRGPSWNGYVGTDIVRLARDVIGLSIALEDNQSGLHKNGGRPSGLLVTDQGLQKEALAAIKDAWVRAFSGDSRNGVAVMDKGMKFISMAMTAVDAQHLETRKHQIEEVCRMMKVFPQMVMHTDKTATFASAESFFAAHYRHTMRPWLRRWEQAIDRDILDKEGPLEARFDSSELTRASAKDRAELYRALVELGINTRNEIREIEGRAPLPGLDEPLTPMNMGTNNAQNVRQDEGA
jgi:HK97 family phage portal protein